MDIRQAEVRLAVLVLEHGTRWATIYEFTRQLVAKQQQMLCVSVAAVLEPDGQHHSDDEGARPEQRADTACRDHQRSRARLERLRPATVVIVDQPIRFR
jgi:hypothetical protein